MKKFVISLAMVLVLGLAAWAAESDWKGLSLSEEGARLDKLGANFTLDGDAADLLNPILQKDFQYANQDWFSDIGLGMVAEPKEGDQAKLDLALEKVDPKILDDVIKASKMKQCNIWGKYWKPSADTDFFAIDIPEYLNLSRLNTLLLARGQKMAAQGDMEGAAEQGLAVLRIGRHLEKEPIYIGTMFGLATKKVAAEALSQEFDAAGKKDAADKWELYSDVVKTRMELYKKVFNEMPLWEEAKVSALVRDEDVSPGLRIETLMSHHICMTTKWKFAKCALLGPPDWVINLENEYAKRDDLSKNLIDILQKTDVSFTDAQYIDELE